MKLCIVIPFENAEKMTSVWATGEMSVDFQRQDMESVRCTISFAATEIKHHLNKFFPDIEVYFSSKKTEDPYISFRMTENTKADSFAITAEENGAEISGDGRCGALYGAYEILRMQGVRWLSPWTEAQRIGNDDFSLPKESKKYSPSMPLGRGFVFSGYLKESEKLFLWMARNRLNIGAYRMNSGALQNKLGFVFKDGGHFFEKMLAPDRAFPDGKTLWETHKDWYGKPADGNLTKENALSNQFCVSQTDLLDFLAEEIIADLSIGKWKNLDRLEIAGFDTWGNACSCDKCKKMGNSTDQHLHFISHIRTRIDEARKSGRLNRNVIMALDIYEGTATLQPPINGIPENLKDSGDYIIHYPILRCYKHKIDDKACSYNDFYYTTMKKWKGIPSMVGEYYNVTKFEDLPLLFTNTIPNDVNAYKKLGVSGMTYMHLPIMNWGVRTITQLLYALVSWDCNADIEKFLEEYFSLRYGIYATKMRTAYTILEEAWQLCSSWRAWCGKSILSNLMSWDGKRPRKKLYYDDHFDDDMYLRGADSINKMEKALSIMKEVRNDDCEEFLSKNTFEITIPKNPTEVCFGNQVPVLFDILGEDIRGVEYGIDTMKLMSDFCLLYEKKYKGEPVAEVWKSIEETVEKLDSYYVPITFTSRVAEMYCYDAFTRTQLKALYFRCKKNICI